MKLSRYMARHDLDDEGMAEKVRAVGVKCDRTMISKYRRLRCRPDWPMINALAQVTCNAVTADDWMSLEAAE